MERLRPMKRSLQMAGCCAALFAGALALDLAGVWHSEHAPGTALGQMPTPAGTGKRPMTGTTTTAGKAIGSAEGEKGPRQELFVDWPKPDFLLVFSGQQLGYIEPCGCTGLANQKGGLARRHTFLKELQAKWNSPVIPMDVGNQVRRFGKQQELKFTQTADALRTMKYAAVTFGDYDLRLSGGELFAATNVPNEDPSIFTDANVALLGRDLTPAFRVVPVASKKLGVAGVLGASYEKTLNNQAGVILHSAPLATKESLPDAAKALAAEKPDLQILLAHATLDESKALAQKFPQFSLVVTAGGLGEPPLQMEGVKGTNSFLVEVGQKGMYLAVVGVYGGSKPNFRYQRVPLDDRFGDSPEMRKVMATYQNQLKALKLVGLGVTAQPHPKGKRFVGSEKCGECHSKAFEVWKKTPHAEATDSLVHPKERDDVARHYDPECLSCHVTGWEPQKFFPFNSGFTSLEATSHLKGNGCENCHGPGSGHVAAEEGKAGAMELAALRASMRLPLASGVAEKKCLECHDLDNSPDFHVKGAFEKYWKAVEHKGKD